LARLQIFISYRSTDRALVEKLAGDLRQLGHDIWFDQELHRAGGQEWWANILAQIRACDLFIFAVSDGALASIACQRELKYAAALQKRILPIVIKDSQLAELPIELQRIQLIHYEGQTRAQGIDLTASLYNLPAALPVPDPLPPEPPIPIPPQEERLNHIDQILQAASFPKEQQALVLVELEDLIAMPAYKDRALARLRRFIEHEDLNARYAARAQALLAQHSGAAANPARGRRRSSTLIFAVIALFAVIGVGIAASALQSLPGSPASPTMTPTRTATDSLPPLATTQPPAVVPTTSVPVVPTGTAFPAAPTVTPTSRLPGPPPLGPYQSPTPEAPTPEPPKQSTVADTCALHNPIHVGVDAVLAPFEYADSASGQSTGFEIDLLTAIAERGGLRIAFINVPGNNLEDQLAFRNLDIIMTGQASAPGSGKRFDYATPHYLESYVFVLASSDAGNYTTPESLGNLAIGVVEGSFAAELLKTSPIASPTIKPYRDLTLAFRAITAGEVNAVLVEYSQAAHALRETPDYPLAIAPARFADRYPFAFGVQAGCTDLRAKLDQGLRDAISNGTYAKIAAKYFKGVPADSWGCPYTVKIGDTLGSIATQFKSTAQFIDTANGLGGATLAPGQRLIVSLEAQCAGP
jgi:ABC-type amino acid transport substrate-binding protein